MNQLASLPADIDLHHLIPLYLGGGNEAKLLAALPEAVHGKVHRLFDELRLADETLLAPQALNAALEAQLRPGAAVIGVDGSVVLVPL